MAKTEAACTEYAPGCMHRHALAAACLGCDDALMRKHNLWGWALGIVAGLGVIAAAGGIATFRSSHAIADGPNRDCATTSLRGLPPRGPGSWCVALPWLILEVGHDGHSLVVVDRIDAPCADFVGRNGAYVRVTNRTLEVRLMQQMRNTGRPGACLRHEDVHLPTINGRQIVGQRWPRRLPYGSLPYLTRRIPDAPYPSVKQPLVPRVVGLAVPDAQAILAREGFRAHQLGHGHTVRSQTPKRGNPAPGSSLAHPDAGTVTLHT